MVQFVQDDLGYSCCPSKLFSGALFTLKHALIWLTNYLITMAIVPV